MDSSAARQPATGISAGPGRSGERGKATLPWARVPRRRRLLSGGLVAACIAIASLVGPNDVAGHELCANNVEFPAQHAGLAFCPEYRYGCCSAAQDGLVKQQFEQWVGTLPANNSCAALFRGMACSHCDAWGAHLLGTEEAAAAGRDISIPPVPFICKDFCGQVFDACGRTVLQSNPFLGNRSGSLSEAYATKEAFCTASSIEGQYCYSGKVFEAPTNVSAPIVDSTNATLNHHPLCLTRVGHQRYLSIAEFPGKNTLITHTQSGKFYLYDMAKWSGVGAFPQPKLLMDLSGEIIYSGELGMFSMAFHPSFASNGLFYLSYTCDTVTNAATCPPAAECGCKAPQCTSDAEDICRYVSTVAEYYYNATSDTAPVEKRKIFRLGQPFSNHNGGQLLMSPTGEPHLFLTLGDGGNAGDPYNFAQSSTSLLGKILKFDLSRTDPTWALQYGTFGEMGEGWRGEIFAAGLRNPWRCDWLPDEAESLMCADVGQNAQEELTIVDAGSNHGWPFIEGVASYRGQPPADASLVSPIFHYTHENGPRSVTGGVFHFGKRDKCKTGAFLAADLYGGGFITEKKEDGSWTTQEIGLVCAANGLECRELRGIIGFGNGFGNTFMLTDNGVYVLNDPEMCGISMGSGCAARVAGMPNETSPVAATTTTRTRKTKPTGKTATATAAPESGAAMSGSSPNLVPLWATVGAIGGVALITGLGVFVYLNKKKEQARDVEVASKAESNSGHSGSGKSTAPDNEGFDWEDRNLVPVPSLPKTWVDGEFSRPLSMAVRPMSGSPEMTKI